MTRPQTVALAATLVVAAILRFVGLAWDDFQHHHPDERYITWVATTIEFPSLGALQRRDWQPDTATFNPFRWPPGAGSEGIVVLQDQPRDFAYGHVPLYLGVLATRLVERVAPAFLPWLPASWSLTADVLNGAGRIEFHHLAAVGRALTALVDVGTVFFLFLLGRRLFGVAVGLVAAALLAITVLHIQLAHFFTSDPYLTFFVVAALWAMVAAHGAAAGRGRWGYTLVAAALVGLAIGSKFTAVLLVVPLLWTIWSGWRPRRSWPAALLALGVAFLVFALTNPFALLDWTCPAPERPIAIGSLALPAGLARSCYLQDLATQSAMVRGRLDLGFTRQYAGTWPYLYFIEMQVRWGMGPLLGVVAFAGLGWAVWRAGRHVRRAAGDSDSLAARLAAEPLVIPLLWVVPYFLITGSFTVKFMRYMQPIVPLLILFGAAMLWQWRWRIGRRVALAAVLVTTALYALAFVAIYRQPHPWNSASRWVYENIPPGATLLSETYDDSLPVTMTLDGQRRRREETVNVELDWLAAPDAADDQAKLMANLTRLAEAEYVTIVSNRVYGVVPRLPERFPLSFRYHQLLFDGSLGYDLVWVGGRTPRLGGMALTPDTFGWPGLRPPAGVADYLRQQPRLSFGRADESFVVYDQPLTMIFRNTGGLTADEMATAFSATFRTPTESP